LASVAPEAVCMYAGWRSLLPDGARREQVLSEARAKVAQESGGSLETWEVTHRRKIDTLLAERGFTE